MKLPILNPPITRTNYLGAVARIKAANGILNGPLPPKSGNCLHKAQKAYEKCLDKYCVNLGRYGRLPICQEKEFKRCVNRVVAYQKRGCKGSISKV